MGWQDLLQDKDETVTAPWIGGRALRRNSRKWDIKGRVPQEHGWYSWSVTGRNASLVGPSDPPDDWNGTYHLGYMVGDLFVPDSQGGKVTNHQELMAEFARVRLLEPLDHFDRVKVHRFWDDGPLFFAEQAFPLGPEADVLDAYVERKTSLEDIQEVPPALDLCFRMKSWYREWVEVKREEERKRLEAEERARHLRESLGNGAGRRQMAKVDFGAAAKAALDVAGAEYSDHRESHGRNEYVVRYRLDGGRYECVVSSELRCIDSGVCLTSESTGEKGDTYFTLESLPGVIRQAVRENKLVVYRRW